MPARPRAVASTSRQQPGFAASLYREMRSPENAAVLKSVAIFAVRPPAGLPGLRKGADT